MHIERATSECMDSLKNKNVLPALNIKQADPFLLIHHMGQLEIKAGNASRLPPHLHVGFEELQDVIVK
jgi:redox-sensitive bicupin YhaK (pirin superfamily)